MTWFRSPSQRVGQKQVVSVRPYPTVAAGRIHGPSHKSKTPLGAIARNPPGQPRPSTGKAVPTGPLRYGGAMDPTSPAADVRPNTAQAAGTLSSITYQPAPQPSGGVTTLHIEPRRTILVGRNAAGKSWLLEGLRRAFSFATNGGGVEHSLDFLQFELAIQVGKHRFDYLVGTEPRVDKPGDRGNSRRPQPPVSLVEKVRVDGQMRIKVRQGQGTVDDARVVLANTGTSMLGSTVALPTPMNLLRTYFYGFVFVRPGVPRRGGRRGVLVERTDDSAIWNVPKWEDGVRLGLLAAQIANWHDSDRALFDQFLAALSRMGVANNIHLLDFQVGQEPVRHLGILQVDGIEFGFLSDGTLRMMEILAAIIERDTNIIVIEEPETSVHPALLEKMLNEIAAIANSKQVIISTHSPQVVSWAEPSDLRLVQWNAPLENRPSVFSLSPAQIADLKLYLEEDGSMGEFVFEGGLDD